MKAIAPDAVVSPAVRQWEELCADRSLAGLPYKIETNRSGKLIMSPASYSHSNFQGEIFYQLKRLMRKGITSVECAIQTADGIKAADVAWTSTARARPHRAAVCLPFAPEICVEVASPSNTRQDMEEKKELYFGAGALEVWFCDKKGAVTFYAREGTNQIMPHSALCLKFPSEVHW